jgi:hypothetical protein
VAHRRDQRIRGPEVNADSEPVLVWSSRFARLGNLQQRH